MSDDITRAEMFHSDNTITTFSLFCLFLFPLLCYIFFTELLGLGASCTFAAVCVNILYVPLVSGQEDW